MSAVLESNSESQDSDGVDNTNRAEFESEPKLAVERFVGESHSYPEVTGTPSPSRSTCKPSASHQPQQYHLEKHTPKGDKRKEEIEEELEQQGASQEKILTLTSPVQQQQHQQQQQQPSHHQQQQQQQRQQQYSQQQQPHQSLLLLHPPQSNGYYDAEKCRAHIADQIRVSKIDRFAAQVNKAVEIETSLYSRLCGLFNMFMNRSAQVTYEFTMRCKMSLNRHRQDRMLARSGNWKRFAAGGSKPNAGLKSKKLLEGQHQEQHSKGGPKVLKRHGRILSDKCPSISNDLLYGQGVQLLQTLFAQNDKIERVTSYHQPQQQPPDSISSNTTTSLSSEHKRTGETGLSSIEGSLVDSFQPGDYVSLLEEYIRKNMRKSRLINSKLSALRQMFERLAAEHRDKVDLVYSAEEERQSTTVVRRSAYNLSLVAIKATKTPIHVNLNPIE